MTRPSASSMLLRLTNTLAAARQARGMTQEQLAAKLGRHRSTIIEWEAGQRLPEIINLFAWAAAVNVEISANVVPNTTPASGGEG